MSKGKVFGFPITSYCNTAGIGSRVYGNYNIECAMQVNVLLMPVGREQLGMPRKKWPPYSMYYMSNAYISA